MVLFKDKTPADVQKHKSIWVADQIWAEHQDILYCNGAFWNWDGRIYRLIDDIDFMILISRRFPAFEESSPAKQKEIMEVYKRNSKIKPEDFSKDDGICFLNKYLNLTTLEAHDHDKSRFNTILIPYDYDPQAQCPLWHEKLAEIMDNDLNKVKCIQEFFGYCLTRETKYEKGLFCIGEGATGKSTVLNVLTSIIGSDNISVLSPRYYRDSMRISSIENKLVLMSHEVPKRLEDYEAETRQIISGQAIEVNKKFIPPYKITPFCKVILAMNELPRIDDHSVAFIRRMLPIEFNKRFLDEKQDKNLKDKFVAERAGILNWALEGLKRLRERGDFFKDAYMTEHIEEIRLQNNPIASWAKEFIFVEEGKEIIKSETYQKYSVWCGLNGHKVTSNSRFSSEFYKIFRSVTKKNTRQSAGEDRKYVWPGLTWASNTTKVQEQVSWDE